MICGLPALELARVRVLGADRKKSGLWGRDCELHVRVFQGPRWIRHVARERMDSIAFFVGVFENLRYDRLHVSEFAAYSTLSTLETVFENFRVPATEFAGYVWTQVGFATLVVA